MITCISKMVEDPIMQEEIIDEIDHYQEGIWSFGRDIAVQQRKNKKIDPGNWLPNSCFLLCYPAQSFLTCPTCFKSKLNGG